MPSKEFLQFFLQVSDGKHDNLVVNESLPSRDLSSDVSSDEKDEIMEDKIKELSYKLKFCDTSNSKFLEPIINVNKHTAFEIVSEVSCSIPTLKKEEIFLSDSESENDLKKKHLVFEGDKTSNQRLHCRKKKDLKVLKNKKEKNDSREDRKNNESKSGENIPRLRSHSSIPTLDQDPKINLNNFTIADTSTNVVVSPRQLTNINENIKKNNNKKKVNNETSSSGDEDWEDLAEKNLFLRSKTLGQKVKR